MQSAMGLICRRIPLLLLATFAGVPTASAQMDAGLRKDEAAPSTSVVVGEDEHGLTKAYTIEFGDEKDWIQLLSGEWLRGNVERMRDARLDFHSDEIKEITYDWKKVQQLHSPKANTYRFTDGTKLVGPAMINKELVTVQTETGIAMRKRSELNAILEHTPREGDYWSTVLRVGLTANAGNTENLSFNAFWLLVREDSLTRTALSYDGTFGTADRTEVANRHLGSGEVNVFVYPGIYVIAANAQLLYDKFQNVRLRATPAAGAGFQLIATYVVDWKLELAPLGYQYLSLLEPAANVRNPQHDGLMMFRMFADIDFTDDIELLLEWRSNLVYTTIGNTNHLGNVIFNLRVTTILYFNTSFLYLRTRQPFPQADGTVPGKNDYQLVVGISLHIS
ncbi:MAG: DUF481 domain-containing protein [Myxococcales bacterium]|nr:DUF481 domain-containing protein [Deltaproteobacteria bacterium]NNL23093.1 DUF481 domain-containing protein [Myxococcales bacterium]